MAPAHARDDLQALYSTDIRKWASKVRADRRLVPANASITHVSRTCGSTVTLDICYEGETIVALGYRTRACTLGMAATAVVAQIAPGHTQDEIAGIRQQLARFLAGEEVLFPPAWTVLTMFSAARRFPARHDAILLPFDILLPRDNLRVPAGS
ncbi:TPA: iron-sulfur cluster assembly scaffold protein [Pseudomonas aeruginosa]